MFHVSVHVIQVGGYKWKHAMYKQPFYTSPYPWTFTHFTHYSTYTVLYLLDSLCSGRVQLQASGAQLSVHLLHLAIMGGRELPDPPVLFH